MHLPGGAAVTPCIAVQLPYQARDFAAVAAMPEGEVLAASSGKRARLPIHLAACASPACRQACARVQTWCAAAGAAELSLHAQPPSPQAPRCAWRAACLMPPRWQPAGARC